MVHLLKSLPVLVETFGRQSGWDCSQPRVRGVLLVRRLFQTPNEFYVGRPVVPARCSPVAESMKFSHRKKRSAMWKTHLDV